MAASRESMAAWVNRWRRLGPELERERATEFALAETRQTIASLNRAYRLSLETHPPSPDSGLIEQQRLFQRLRDA